MSEPDVDAGSLAGPADADLLAAVAAARAAWLERTIEILAEHPWVSGVGVVGSLGRDEADGYSDVDLVVAVGEAAPADVFTDPVAGLGLPGDVLYQRPKPSNAPAGGGYLAVCIELEGLPVLLDLYLWPADTAVVPAGGHVLFERERLPRSDLGLLALLDQHPAADRTGSDPGDPATLMLLVQLAAKYHARGDRHRLAGICRQLQVPDIANTDELRQVLDTRLPALRPAPAAGLAAISRLLDLVAATTKENPPMPGSGR